MRLIDADAVDFTIPENPDFMIVLLMQVLKNVIDQAPTIDPESLIPQGEWIVQDIGRTKFSCSHCKARNYGGHEKYCPNCGG